MYLPVILDKLIAGGRIEPMIARVGVKAETVYTHQEHSFGAWSEAAIQVIEYFLRQGNSNSEEITLDQRSYMWDHYRYNAEQRLKGFNFFVVLSVFAEGGIFTAVEKNFHPLSLALLGGFVVILSTVFWLVDARSRELLSLSMPGLKQLEIDFPENCRLFTRDAQRKGFIVRYTFAIRTLLIGQFIFGAGVACYGLYHYLLSP